MDAPPTNLTQAIVVGCSAGGTEALRVLLAGLQAEHPAAVIVVAHSPADGVSLLPALLSHVCRLPVSEARERERILPGHVYLAPPNYHLLVELDRTFGLSVDERVCYVRPAIDVLFESAADAFGRGLTGVVLTGANNDGAKGMIAIKAAGGRCLVQDPAEAYAAAMPAAAIATGCVDQVLPLEKLAEELVHLGTGTKPPSSGSTIFKT
jgi:two-component system, chemotaxis family, protein-glutamate methylesterase/glutaminase